MSDVPWPTPLNLDSDSDGSESELTDYVVTSDSPYSDSEDEESGAGFRAETPPPIIDLVSSSEEDGGNEEEEIDIDKPLSFEDIDIDKPLSFEDIDIDKPLSFEDIDIDKPFSFEDIDIDKPFSFDDIGNLVEIKMECDEMLPLTDEDERNPAELEVQYDELPCNFGKIIEPAANEEGEGVALKWDPNRPLTRKMKRLRVRLLAAMNKIIALNSTRILDPRPSMFTQIQNVVDSEKSCSFEHLMNQVRNGQFTYPQEFKDALDKLTTTCRRHAEGDYDLISQINVVQAAILRGLEG